jgi:hypothetical protein
MQVLPEKGQYVHFILFAVFTLSDSQFGNSILQIADLDLTFANLLLLG